MENGKLRVDNWGVSAETATGGLEGCMAKKRKSLIFTIILDNSNPF